MTDDVCLKLPAEDSRIDFLSASLYPEHQNWPLNLQQTSSTMGPFGFPLSEATASRMDIRSNLLAFCTEKTDGSGQTQRGPILSPGRSD